MIVNPYGKHGRVARYPIMLMSFAAAVVLCLALSAWFVMAQRAVPDGPFGRINNQPIATVMDSLVVAPEALRPVSTQQAQALNAAAPLSATPNPAARPMHVPLSDGINYARSLECLTAAVHYEAASESLDGQRAVAQVVLNRTRHPAFPQSVCGVVFQGAERKTGCQFSFTCDGSLMRVPSKGGWAQARGVAEAALAGYVYGPVGWATHYHTNYVAPYWAPTLAKAAVIGAHIFYRWPGGWGRPSAFMARYAGAEPLFDTAVGTNGLKLENMPAFTGMIDPDAPLAPIAPAHTVRSVLPFARPAAATIATGKEPPARNVGPLAGRSPTRWVIGVRPATELNAGVYAQ